VRLLFAGQQYTTNYLCNRISDFHVPPWASALSSYSSALQLHMPFVSSHSTARGTGRRARWYFCHSGFCRAMGAKRHAERLMLEDVVFLGVGVGSGF